MLRLLKRVGRDRGISVVVDFKHGKGSHSTLYYGELSTTIKDLNKDIGRGLLNSMVSDLGLTLDDLYERRRKT